jgi:hypothetical protein
VWGERFADVLNQKVEVAAAGVVGEAGVGLGPAADEGDDADA